MAEITINGITLSTYGVTMLAGSYNSLLKPSKLKEWVSNEPVNGNGVQYIEPTETHVAQRSVDLIFCIQAKSTPRFLLDYRAFIALLQSGMLDLNVPDLGKTYRLKYESCTSFEHVGLTACKLAVTFTEPNPRN